MRNCCHHLRSLCYRARHYCYRLRSSCYRARHCCYRLRSSCLLVCKHSSTGTSRCLLRRSKFSIGRTNRSIRMNDYSPRRTHCSISMANSSMRIGQSSLAGIEPHRVSCYGTGDCKQASQARSPALKAVNALAIEPFSSAGYHSVRETTQRLVATSPRNCPPVIALSRANRGRFPCHFYAAMGDRICSCFSAQAQGD